ncbi:MAG: hypothetical protein QOE98_2570 [Gaiellaceae bacterium]|nr:hypothetical protein [Gaiellaceae bacterium]
MADRPLVRGYTDRPSVAAGGTIAVHVSAEGGERYDATLVRLVSGDANPAGPGIRVEEVLDLGTHPAVPRRTQVGSYVEVAGETLGHFDGSFSVHAFIWATMPQSGRQAIVSRWSDAAACGWALVVEGGVVAFQAGDGTGSVDRVMCDRPVFAGLWYSVVASRDAAAGTLHVSQTPVLTSTNGVFGPVVPLDSACAITAVAQTAPGDAGVPVLIGALAEAPPAVATGRTWALAHFNGKIEAPKLLAGALDDAAATALAAGNEVAGSTTLASWDFAAGITAAGVPSDTVEDVSGNGHDGVCVNQPLRGVTGRSWTGREHDFRIAPHEYGAIRFHEDALDDCRWEPAFDVAIPETLASACYAVRLRLGDMEDYVPFFVTPGPGQDRSPILVVMSTFTYVAYGDPRNIVDWEADDTSGYWFNEAVSRHPLVLDPMDVEVDGHIQPFGPSASRRRIGPYGLALYDTYADGAGVPFATWRKPILRMRPGHTNTFNFLSDLRLIDWLDAKGIHYDVATDHDLDRDGAALLRPYATVVTGSHPEYYSGAMIDGWEEYLSSGGRGMYLGGNGFYWVTASHPDKPWLIEVRDKGDGDGAWAAQPGERRHAFTGEQGGTWRNRGRPPQKVWGTGYTAHMLDQSSYFVQLPDAADPRVAWIFDGIEPDERIGEFGISGGGAAGVEVDRYDRALGTPPHALLLASSVGHSASASVVTDDISYNRPGIAGDEHPLVRGDIVYFTTPDGGAMFSTSSIAWCGSLSWNGYDNNVSRLTENVLRRFAAPEPLPPVV